MKKKRIVIFSIVFLCIFILLILGIYLGFIRNKRLDLTKSKNRKSYIVAEDKNINSLLVNNEKTVVVFWATWCKFCVEEADELNSFIIENKDIPVIIVSHDYEKENLDNYLNEKKYNWYFIFDAEKSIREGIDSGATGIPSTYILNKNGEIEAYHKGKLNKEQFEKLYNELRIEG